MATSWMHLLPHSTNPDAPRNETAKLGQTQPHKYCQPNANTSNKVQTTIITLNELIRSPEPNCHIQTKIKSRLSKRVIQKSRPLWLHLVDQGAILMQTNKLQTTGSPYSRNLQHKDSDKVKHSPNPNKVKNPTATHVLYPIKTPKHREAQCL